MELLFSDDEPGTDDISGHSGQKKGTATARQRRPWKLVVALIHRGGFIHSWLHQAYSE